MINDTIAAINERIAQQLDTTALQVAGICVPFQDQQANAVSLVLPAEGKRFEMDSSLVWQSAHLTDGSRVTSSRTFGSFTDNQYDVRFVLIGLSKSQTGMDVAMRAVDGVGYVVIDSTENDTLTVLSRYFRVKVGQAKNYDPALYAFAIRYHIVGVDDDDYAQLPDTDDLAVLPVIVPEPTPGPQGPPGPEGDTGPIGPPGEFVKSSYVHNQNIPASVWLITHDLGYNPGGIQVYDSAGELWWPSSVNYTSATTLQLGFGTVSFAGKAYLS